MKELNFSKSFLLTFVPCDASTNGFRSPHAKGGEYQGVPTINREDSSNAVGSGAKQEMQQQKNMVSCNGIVVRDKAQQNYMIL